TAAPEAPPRALADAAWPGELRLGWTASPSADVAHYLVYRGEARAPDPAGPALAEVKGLSYVDNRVVAGLEHRYAVVAVDRAGNRGRPSEVVAAVALVGEGPRIASVTVEPFGKPLKPGQVITLTVTGQGDAKATVDLGALGQSIALAEQGRTGRYLGSYVVKAADVGPAKTLHRVVARLIDGFGAASDLAGPELAVAGLDTLNDVTPPAIAKAAHDGARAAGFSGKLVAGDVLTVTLEGEARGYASFALPGVTSGVAMREGAPGVYTGAYTVGQADEGTGVGVVATLADEAGNETAAPVGAPVSFDTRVRLTVTAKDPLLPADRKSQTRLTAKAVDANGGAVCGHELALTLSTTEEYTGVVGGGRLEDREARKDDEDNLEVRWGGVTDAFGEVTATYTAGFAAKTALVVAKDLTTGDVGAGWLNTYVASTVAIELVPRAQRGAEDRARLRLTADPAWLTADGRSTSRLKAVLTDLAGNPLAGQRVAFALGNQNGRLKVLRGGVTDDQGLAEAEYRAGTLAGEVTVTAAAAEWGVTAAVQIELRADAPAKLDLVASADRVVTGDKATLTVRVTDVHDNPNRAVPVTFAVLQGSGTVAAPALLTDRYGEGQAVFTAGGKAGVAIIEARHTSRAPTDDELRRIHGTVFVPRFFERQDRDRIKLARWLVKPGDEVEKGQALATLESRQGTWTLTAPAKGVFVRQLKHERDRVELGDTLGYVEVDPVVWKGEYAR
ncbi:MAG: Ig-like domain-containing protein, partial [Deferrisomatales bacterium]